MADDNASGTANTASGTADTASGSANIASGTKPLDNASGSAKPPAPPPPPPPNPSDEGISDEQLDNTNNAEDGMHYR